MIPYDHVLPVAPVAAGSGGVPSRKALLKEMSNIWNKHSIKARILFFCGNVNMKMRAAPLVDRLNLYAYMGLFDQKYLPLLQGPDRIRLLAHYNLAAASFVEEKAYVMINSDKDARNLDNAWNAFARPTLEKRKVRIIWLDVKGNPREPIYPPQVLPPGQKMRKGMRMVKAMGNSGGVEETEGASGGQVQVQAQAKSESENASESESAGAAKGSRVKVHFTYE